MDGEIFPIPAPDTYESPMFVDMGGTDYCHDNYIICRRLSNVTVFGYVLSGSGTLHINSKISIAKAGDLFIIPVNSDHEYYPTPLTQEPWSFLWLNLKGNLPSILLKEYHLDTSPVIENLNVENVFTQSLQLLESKALDLNQLQNRLISLVYHILLEAASAVGKRKLFLSPNVQLLKDYHYHPIEVE